MKTIAVIALLCLLLGTAHSLTNYQYNFNTLTSNFPYYDLGYIYSGTTIQVKISIPGATNFDISDIDVTLFPEGNTGGALTPVSIDPATITAADLLVTYTFEITTGDSYILTLVSTGFPATNNGATVQAFKYFYLHVTSFLTSSGGPSDPSTVVTTLYKSTEVLRDKVTKLIYVEADRKLSFSLWPVPETGGGGSPDTAKADMYLFAVAGITHSGSEYAFTNTNLFDEATLFTETTWNAANLRLTYDQSSATDYLAAGFYVLTVTYTEPQASIVLNFNS